MGCTDNRNNYYRCTHLPLAERFKILAIVLAGPGRWRFCRDNDNFRDYFSTGCLAYRCYLSAVRQMVSYFLVILAAIFNAVMDRLETEISFNASVFRNLNPEYWCKPKSAHKVKFLPFTRYRPDAWHISKSAMIFCWVGAVVLYRVQLPYKWLDFIVLGLMFNLVFENMYAKVFKG